MDIYQIDKHDPQIIIPRLIDALGRLQPVLLRQKDGTCLLCSPVEAASEPLLAHYKKAGSATLLVTAMRAAMLGAQVAPAGRIDVSHATAEEILALAENKPDGLMPAISSGSLTDDELLTCCKRAALLPALLIAPVDANDYPSLAQASEEDLHAYFKIHSLPAIDKISETALPMKNAPDANVICFRTGIERSMHLALMIGSPNTDAPLVRVHSSCVTGDILGSLRCDCGDQLQLAIKQMQDAGGGILLYLHQEGRGIGIANKLRAYHLQEQGLNTYEANKLLGFDEDERDFSIAASILKTLKVSKVRLLTNNPAKMENLDKHGIKIVERLPIIAPTGPHNEAYLKAKNSSGHLF